MPKASSVLSKMSAAFAASGPLLPGGLGAAAEIGGMLLGLGAAIAEEHEKSGTDARPAVRRVVSQWPRVRAADAAADAEQARIAAGRQ